MHLVMVALYQLYAWLLSGASALAKPKAAEDTQAGLTT